MCKSTGESETNAETPGLKFEGFLGLCFSSSRERTDGRPAGEGSGVRRLWRVALSDIFKLALERTLCKD